MAHSIHPSRRAALWFLGVLLALPLLSNAQAPDPADAQLLELGRRLYTEGVRPSGEALAGTRFGGNPVSGARAACVNCHRPSGMGQVEGDIQVPPITGNFLYASRADKRVATMDPRVSKLFNQAHEPYNEASLSAAIRSGVNNRGMTMNTVMPRFALSDAELRALTAYLNQLSAQWSPGVTATSVRFATVITPDVDPARRKVFVDMLRAVFRQKNSSTVTAAQSRTRHHMTSAAEMVLGTERSWELDIWELQGPPQSWGEQLTARQRAQPAFALLSGLSGSIWQPVHDFCDHEHVPCWFPSVELPGTPQSAYALYFSGGVTLEAAVLARHLQDQAVRPQRVLQVYRDGEVGRAAALALKQGLAGSGVIVSERVLRSDPSGPEALREALVGIEPGDTLMLWLRRDDIRALEQIRPVAVRRYFSSVLGQGEHAPLPSAWRANSSLLYPYELPQLRAKNLDYFRAWLSISKIPLVDEAMQSEVFFALSFMTDTLAEMLDNLYRDYLLERAESLLSVREGTKSEQETRDRLFLGREGDLAKKYGALTIPESARVSLATQAGGSGKSHGTTLYPHLSLGAGQRLASKSGYIVRFADGTGATLVAESELIVP